VLSSRGRSGLSLATAAMIALAASGCLGNDDDDAGSRAPTESAACGYLYEWISAWKFPLQPDPQAAYSYVVPKVTSEPIGYVISGPFPYAAWTSWTIYNGKALPFSLAEDSDIKPDRGSVNPFVVDTPVLAPKRDFKLLVLPRGTDAGSVAESLQDIPASNQIESPTSGKFFIIANRVYNAFPGYNRGGATGPTKTPFPEVEAVNYKTGEAVDCSQHNLLPSPKPATDMPTTAATESASPAALELTDGTKFPIGPRGSLASAPSGKNGLRGAQFAPELDPDRIEMTRPPLLPGADVSSIPPADNCAGYLGAATSTTKIGLIRMPHVAHWFETGNLTRKTTFTQEQTTFISFTQYGDGLGEYDPGSPNTGSLGNSELKVDSTGGSTIVIWPRNLKTGERRRVFAIADRNGWAVLRGGDQGPVTTANLLVRLKGASQSYSGRYSPSSEQQGVPCYFDDHPKATRWSDVTGAKYVANGENIGAGAPQGVNCTVSEFLDGGCLASLKAYIGQTGGSYTVR
jgi:hypothetical protein